MSHEFDKIETESKAKNGSITSYVTGFIFSLILTLSAYLLVVKQALIYWVLIFVIIGLGLIQMVIQLLFFLHLGSEFKPRWNLLSFLFMTIVVILLVGGSLWIMYSLENRVMPAVNIILLH